MIAKHLEGFVNFLLGLAGVPTQFPPEAGFRGEGLDAAGEDDGNLPMLPAKNFLHYL